MTTPQTLDQWRTTWTADEITWAVGWTAWREQREEERTIRKRELARRDRKNFGDELWGVSEGHRLAESRSYRDLPPFRSEIELAAWLDISLGRLRWFTHDEAADTVWHYTRYEIPKRSGGRRVILAPKSELKAIQRKIYHEIVNRVPVSAAAHGFVPDRSIVTNARPHSGKAVVLNIDLKDFFPSITFPRVRGLFIRWGYSFTIASVLALLCTEYERKPFQQGEGKFYISLGARHLVQGAPTSPALANHIAWNLDRRLAGLAKSFDFTYTRYADDLTFSGDNPDHALRILDVAQRIISEEGFRVNAAKTRLYRPSSRQIVTGIVVNDGTSTPRDLRRRVRAILHQAEKTGLAAQNREGRDNFRAYLQGLIGYIHEANPDQARGLLEKLKAIPD